MQSSRRSALKRVMFFAGAAAALPWAAPASAQAKASKQSMQYQEHPHNGQECSTCLQFIPGSSPTAPGQCKVVEGQINPKGWCIAYVKKP